MKISCSWPLEGFVDSFFLKKLSQVGNATNCKPWLRAICQSFDAHSALEDVETLQSLVLHLQTSSEVFLKQSFIVDFVIYSIQFKSKTNDNLFSLQPLSHSVSNYMFKKITQSGLSYKHLKLLMKEEDRRALVIY